MVDDHSRSTAEREQAQAAFLLDALHAMLDPQGWALAWMEGNAALNPEAVAWMQARPPAVQALMRRFPPSCLVRATVPLGCPAPGTVGIVSSYFEDGTLTVRQGPDSTVRAQCAAEDLEVVGYWRGLTPERVAAVLEDE